MPGRTRKRRIEINKRCAKILSEEIDKSTLVVAFGIVRAVLDEPVKAINGLQEVKSAPRRHALIKKGLRGRIGRFRPKLPKLAIDILPLHLVLRPLQIFEKGGFACSDVRRRRAFCKRRTSEKENGEGRKNSGHGSHGDRYRAFVKSAPERLLTQHRKTGRLTHMFPIRDHNPSERTPFVTWALIGLNVAIFVSYYAQMFDDQRALGLFFYQWGLVPAEVTSTSFVTSMFLHGGPMHLIGNMLFLWVFGDNMEDQMGSVGFLGFYLGSGIAAALAQVLADPSSTIPVVGASGAIAGVMGGYLLMFPKARVDILIILIIIFRVIPVPAWLVLGAWFCIQLVQGSMTPTDMGGVAYWAHAGGFAAGLLLTIPLWRRRGGPAFWRRTEGHPPHPEARYRTVRTSVPTVRRRR